MEQQQRNEAGGGSRRRDDRKVQAAAKKSTRVRRGSAVLARTNKTRTRTRIQSLRALGVSAGREVTALVAGALAVLFLLSLLSYHPRDTLVGQWGEAGGEPVRNWIGPLGARLAEWAVALLGSTAFAFPLLLILLGAATVWRRGVARRWLQILGFVMVMGALALLVQLAFPAVPFRGATLAGGGGLGEVLKSLLVPNLSTVGTAIVGLTGLLVGGRLGFGVRVTALARSLGHGARRGTEPIVGAAGAGVDGARRGVRGLADAIGRWWERAVDEHREAREVAREERRFRREERLAQLEEARLLGQQEEPELLEDPEEERAPEPEPRRLEPPASPRSTLFAPAAPIARDAAEEPVSRIQLPVSSRPAIAPVPRPGESLVQTADTADGMELPPLVDSIRDDGVEVRVDSMRGATSRGVVHAEIRAKGRGTRPAVDDEDADEEQDSDDGDDDSVRADSLPDAPAASFEHAPPVGRPAIVRPAARIASGDEPIPSPREAREALVGRRTIKKAGRGDEPFELPSLSLLSQPPEDATSIDEDDLERQAARLEETLGHYNVQGRVTNILPGPVVTMFEFEPAPGIKVSRIANLENDLAMALRATRVRIVAPIPGKGAVGIEIPSTERETIYLRELLSSKEFRNPKLRLPLAVGKAIDATPVCSDWAKMPHILVAGTTGSGKSVCVNSFIVSLLYSMTPADLRMILVDPKMLEFSMYDGIPHLLVPVVTSPKKAAVALRWAVEEMTRRYKVLAAMNTRNIIGYNEKAAVLTAEWAVWDEAVFAGKAIGMEPPNCGRELGSDNVCFRSRGGKPVGPPEKMPYIVIIIDELADLMMVARKEVEESIVRLAQMARAAGIHMLLATQRPSVDVITGLIKANFPTRLSFKVSSKVDSRTVLDANGAENLLGMGDGLFLAPGSSDVKRIHGAFVTDEEVERIVAHLKEQGEPDYVEQVLAGGEDEDDDDVSDEELDDMYDAAVACVAQAGKASTSLLQRKLGLGYNRAARIMDAMERNGVIGPANGAKPRDVFAQSL